MRTDVTLGDMRREVQIEAGLSTAAGHSLYSKERIDQMINRTQRMMARSDKWPPLKTTVEATIAAGTSTFTGLATATRVKVSDIDAVYVRFGDDWLKVEKGIGPREWSIWPDTYRSNPFQRWDFAASNAADVDEPIITLLPMANTDQVVRVQCTATPADLTDDADRPSLDADVIVMRVAAQIMGRDNKADAALLLQQAEELENSIIKNMGSAAAEPINFAGKPSVRLRPGIDYIPPGSGM